MENNETALEMCLRMLKERSDYWNLRGNQCDPYLRGNFFGRADTYKAAVSILEYAMQDNIECLRQLDYYHEEEEE